MKDSAIIYRNFIDAVEMLPAEMQGEAYSAYLRYAMDHEEYAGNNFTIAALLKVFMGRIIEDQAAYEAKCQRAAGARKNIRKNSDDINLKSDDINLKLADGNSDINLKSEEENTDINLKSDRNQTEINNSESDISSDIDIEFDIREKDANASKERAPRHRYGAYSHVLLTDDEYQKLYDSFGEPTRTELINKLDEYCQETGKTYKDYYLVIAKKDSWVQREVMKPKRPVNKAEKEARRGTERGTDYDAAVRDFAMNPPEGLALPFNDPNDANVLDALAAM